MPLDYDAIRNWPIPEVTQRYDERDAILYALGVGFGHDPLDREQLRFVYEDGLKVAPTMPVVLGYPGFWVRETPIDWKLALHAEQSLVLHRAVPAAGTVVGRSRVTRIVDKGSSRGAIVYVEREISDQATGEPIATTRQSLFCRGDGGFGGGDEAPERLPGVPAGAPDAACALATLPSAALIYRLCGDTNPLHADPDVAELAGFPRPILHGLCTYGVAAHALVKTCCGYDPTRMKRIAARFSGPVVPGDTLRTEIWGRGTTRHFRTVAVERDAVVLDDGIAELA
jgi:acyl dehydratase